MVVRTYVYPELHAVLNIVAQYLFQVKVHISFRFSIDDINNRLFFSLLINFVLTGKQQAGSDKNSNDSRIFHGKQFLEGFEIP